VSLNLLDEIEGKPTAKAFMIECRCQPAFEVEPSEMLLSESGGGKSAVCRLSQFSMLKSPAFEEPTFLLPAAIQASDDSEWSAPVESNGYRVRTKNVRLSMAAKDAVESGSAGGRVSDPAGRLAVPFQIRWDASRPYSITPRTLAIKGTSEAKTIIVKSSPSRLLKVQTLESLGLLVKQDTGSTPNVQRFTISATHHPDRAVIKKIRLSVRADDKTFSEEVPVLVLPSKEVRHGST
jgi:hypothetical protein